MSSSAAEAKEEARPVKDERERLLADISKAETRLDKAEKDVAEWKKEYKEAKTKEDKDFAKEQLRAAAKRYDQAATDLRQGKEDLRIYDKNKRQEAAEAKENQLLRTEYKKNHGETPFKASLTLEEALQQFDDLDRPIEVKYPHNFYDRRGQLDAAFDLAEGNFRQRLAQEHNQHTFIIVPGGSGIGKSRFGKEIADFIAHRGEKQGTFDGKTVFARYMHVDLNNGERYREKFDRDINSELRLGVRLACVSILRRAFLGVIDKPKSRWAAFTVGNVLKHVIMSDQRLHGDPESVLAIITHIDEFQLYCDASTSGTQLLKEMLRSLGDVMRHGLQDTDLAGRFFVVPVLTGTSPMDIRFLRTDKYKEATVSLLPLTEHSALRMFDDKYDNHPAHRTVRASSHFRVAIHDTGYVPRLLHHMLDVADVSLATNWGGVLASFYLNAKHTDLVKRSLSLDTFGGVGGAAATIQFVLTGQQVVREFVLPGGKSISDLERTGEVVLLPGPGAENFVLMMPFVQLRAINHLLVRNSTHIFAAELLFSPTHSRPWRWQDFEELHAEFQAVRINALVAARQALLAAKTRDVRTLQNLISVSAPGTEQSSAMARHEDAERALQRLNEEAKSGFSVSDILPGAVGAKVILQRRVILPSDTTRQRFHESKQMLQKKDDVPDLAQSIACKESSNMSVSVFAGVFLCAPSNAIFDGRFACEALPQSGGKPLLFLWQDKHSGVNVQQSTVSTAVIEAWYEQAKTAVGRCKKDEFDVAFIFLTNRKLVGDADERSKLLHLVEKHNDLLVITRDELPRYLSATLAGRGIVPKVAEE